ncbi:MAG: ATP-grasp domain-containing protein [Nitrososphaerota archaeon]|nr:ATP-grasp domain-containing protein [Candidatus Bathyarchaeota archaeon]MDW8049323.1 ATP-grasp domain-containing protein [Nitrososphaerota archaeon]
MSLKVGLTFNLKRKVRPDEGLPEDFFAEFDDETTVNAIAESLKRGGCRVTKIEADENAYSKIRRLKPHIVFNIAEGLRGESRESQVPAMLEMLGIPYTGSGPLTLAVALDKALTHRVLAASGVPSPNFQVFKSPYERLSRRLRFPLIVKPLAEGSSKGVRNSSLVKDDNSLRNQIAWVIKTYNQPAIVESFLPGREFTVALIGNKDPLVLPIVEILLEKLPPDVSPIYSYEVKWVWDTPEKPLEIFKCPANISKTLEKRIKQIAVKTFKALNCRDLCRIDMRLDEQGEPHVLEVNPLPGLIPDPDAHSCFPEAARAAGFTYDELICTILWQALKRYGLQSLFDGLSLVKLP